jgi:hypothetical protein
LAISRCISPFEPVRVRLNGRIVGAGSSGVLCAPIIMQIRGYDAAEWEVFTREWVKGQPDIMT